MTERREIGRRWYASRRSWFLRGCAVLFALAIAEVVLQVAFHAAPRFGSMLLAPWDERARQINPDAELGFVGNRYWPEHDSWGFRNPRVPRRAGIVALGDSQTYGTAALTGESWPAQLGEDLGLTVYNMGLGGYCSVQALQLLDRALSLRPRQIVFAYYFGNDLYDAFCAVYERGTFPEFRDSALAPGLMQIQSEDPLYWEVAAMNAPPGGFQSPPEAPAEPDLLHAFVSNHVRLYGLMRWAHALGSVGGPRRALGAADDEEAEWEMRRKKAEQRSCHQCAVEQPTFRTILTPAYRAAVQDLEDPRIAEGLRISLAVLLRIHDKCREQKVGFHVVLIPTKESILAPLIGSECEPSGLAELAVHEDSIRAIVQHELQFAGVPVLDLLPVMRQAAEEGVPIYRASENGHPNATGYKIIAEAVASKLVSPQPAQ